MARSAKWFNFDLNDDQLTVLDWVREFCQDVVRPAGAEWDKKQSILLPIIKQAAECGLYSPDFFGQLFSDPTGITAVLAIEELFAADAGIALSLFGTGLPVAAIGANGTPEQIGKWLPACFGTPEEPQVAAFCCSESGAGSDVSKLRTRAVYNEKDNTWTLNGTKDWITNGGLGGVHVVVATVDSALGSRGQASFVVPPGAAGLSQGVKHDKLGIRASHTAEVVLDNVVVPGDCLLGGKDKLDRRLERARKGESAGGQAAMATFEASRWMVAAMGVGVARAALEYSTQYALQRTQHGKVIAEHQLVAAMLADMATDVYMARLGVINAANTALTTGKLEHAQGSMTKYFASEVAVRATRNAVQILGGAGYVKDHPVERWFRDAPILTIFEGTSQIQQLVIASNVTGLRIR